MVFWVWSRAKDRGGGVEGKIVILEIKMSQLPVPAMAVTVLLDHKFCWYFFNFTDSFESFTWGNSLLPNDPEVCWSRKNRKICWGCRDQYVPKYEIIKPRSRQGGCRDALFVIAFYRVDMGTFGPQKAKFLGCWWTFHCPAACCPCPTGHALGIACSGRSQISRYINSD